MSLNKFMLLTLLATYPAIGWGNGTPPPWPVDDPNTELHWGRKAVGGATITGSPPVVYVIDGGVGYHNDLPNVERMSVNAGVSVVGCYPHATHVAGIIAAAKNGTGVAGVAAGAKIVSISIALRNMPGTALMCGDNTPVPDPAIPGSYLYEPYDKNGVLNAFTRVREHAVARWAQGDRRIGIVNLSMNAPLFSEQDVRAAMYALTQPGPNYAGVFIVQAAGNYWSEGQTWMTRNSCVVAYGFPAVDGVMVISAVNRLGSIPREFYNFGDRIDGANVRECVEAYAPGDAIKSTYGLPVQFSRTNPDTWQHQGQEYQPMSYIAELSGTSTAAPHVAGIAAGLLRDNPSLTPIEMEQVLRLMLYAGPADTRTAPDGGGIGPTLLFNSCLSETVPPSTISHGDSDGVPDYVECAEGLVATVKDNDVFSKNRLFAMQQYRDFLAREGDAGGVVYWTNQLATGAQSRAQMVETYFTSAEFQGTGAPVARLYFAYFLRIPDYGGLNFWIGQFRAGNSLNSISDAFAGSPEFINRYGALTNSQFVSLVYQNVLGRAADSGGLAHWTGQLDGGTTRGQMMVQFSESAEYRALIANEIYVTMMYGGMLRREPDAGGFSHWVNYMDAGNSGLALINGFLTAPEYRSRFLP